MKNIILEHVKKYPLMEIRDIAKLIYQSEFGGGHMIADSSMSLRRIQEEYQTLTQVASYVYQDDIFLKEETWEEIEKEAILDTETVEEVSDTLTEKSLNLNGVEDGMNSYSRVVKLLLAYYGDRGRK